jgi:hypothetical protein
MAMTIIDGNFLFLVQIRKWCPNEAIDRQIRVVKLYLAIIKCQSDVDGGAMTEFPRFEE